MKDRSGHGKLSAIPKTGGGILENMVKPLIIFLIITAIVGGRIPETLSEESVDNVNLLIAAVYGALGVILSTTRLHFVINSVILFAVVVINLPKGFLVHINQSLESLLLFPVILVGFWMAVHISRILAFIAFVVGLGLLLPSDVPPPMHMEPSYLLASLVALLITPVIHILTSKRDRGI